MKRTIQIELEIEKETPDFLDKVMGRIYIMDEVKKTGMEAKYVTDGVISAANAVIERWDTPAWKDVPATATFINALRNALKESDDER